MYTQHFGLNKSPFDMHANAEDAFVGPRQAKMISRLTTALAVPDAIVAVSGPVGVGKTTLIDCALASITGKIEIIRIGRMRLEPDDILDLLGDRLGLSPKITGTVQRVSGVKEQLKKWAADGKRVVVIVEDAQRMGIPALLELESLTAAESSTSPGASVILMGQPELHNWLKVPELVRVSQRTRLRQAVDPFSAQEVQGYLTHCLRAAGGDFDALIRNGTVQILHSSSGGIARVIRNLCETTFKTAADGGLKTIAPQLVAKIATDVYGLKAEVPLPPPPPRPAPLARRGAPPQAHARPVPARPAQPVPQAAPQPGPGPAPAPGPVASPRPTPVAAVTAPQASKPAQDAQPEDPTNPHLQAIVDHLPAGEPQPVQAKPDMSTTIVDESIKQQFASPDDETTEQVANNESAAAAGEEAGEPGDSKALLPDLDALEAAITAARRDPHKPEKPKGEEEEIPALLDDIGKPDETNVEAEKKAAQKSQVLENLNDIQAETLFGDESADNISAEIVADRKAANSDGVKFSLDLSPGGHDPYSSVGAHVDIGSTQPQKILSHPGVTDTQADDNDDEKAADLKSGASKS